MICGLMLQTIALEVNPKAILRGYNHLIIANNQGEKFTILLLFARIKPEVRSRFRIIVWP